MVLYCEPLTMSFRSHYGLSAPHQNRPQKAPKSKNSPLPKQLLPFTILPSFLLELPLGPNYTTLQLLRT